MWREGRESCSVIDRVLLGEGEMEEHISENERDKGGKVCVWGGGNEKHMRYFPPSQPWDWGTAACLQVQKRTADGVCREAELVGRTVSHAWPSGDQLIQKQPNTGTDWALTQNTSLWLFVVYKRSVDEECILVNTFIFGRPEMYVAIYVKIYTQMSVY